jgi:ankyrin repeat protein
MRPFGRGLLSALALTLAVSAASPPEAPVADAAMRGDVDRVRALLRDGMDVNAAQGDGMTALHWAAELGDVELANILVYGGAYLEASTRLGGFTPLLAASRAGSAGVVSTLLEAGADVGARTTTGETALHFAAGTGRNDAVRALLAHGAEVDAVDANKGQTPLMFAAAFNRTDVVRTLVEHGADVAAQTLVVDYAAVAARDKVLSDRRNRRLAMMHDSDAVIDRPVDGTEAEEESEESEADEVEVSQIPEKNEDRQPLSYDQLVGKQGGNTALLYAAREGQAEAAQVLLEVGADIDQVSGGDRTSPLLMATLNGHFDLAMSLLEQGADPNLASDPGATPLYLAVHLQWAPQSFFPQPVAHQQQETSYVELMEALLVAGADPNPRLQRHLWYNSFNHNVLGVDTWGATPFWRAAYGTDVTAMKLLMEHGADPTIPTYRPAGRESTGNNPDEEEPADPSGLPPVPVGGAGVFPIHAASGAGYGLGLAGNAHIHQPNGWLPSVKYLVEELGVDVNQRDYNGFTALHNAAARGDRELILYLVDQGADVRALTRKGQTTADMANGPVQRVTVFPEIVRLLESLGSDNNHNCVSC